MSLPVIACRDCQHWRPLALQALRDIDRGECKAIPGGWVTDADDFCGMFKPKAPEAPPS